MRIRAFWAEGFRSLKSVHLPELGAFNIFYGENGAGKSNILAALELLVRAAGLHIPGYANLEAPFKATWVPDLVRDEDFCHFAAIPRIRLGLTLVSSSDAPVFAFRDRQIAELTLEITFERFPGRGTCVSVSRLEDSHGADLRPLWHDNASKGEARELRDQLGRWFEETFVEQSYRLVPAVRAIGSEAGELDAHDRASLALLLERGRIKEAFVRALTSPDPVIRTRFARLRRLLTEPPLSRPAFDPVHDPHANTFEIHEQPGRSGGRDVPLDLAGLGIQQIYAVLGQILLGRASAVGIEEPEAHLHAPTSGRHLRELLHRLVELGDVQQLFIATHSNLFDLDPSGYYDVRREDGVTIVERKAGLSEIDLRHLYEPGPAKRGLADLLHLVDPGTPVLRRPDGSPVSAEEMLVMLQEDTSEAVDFLRDVHGAAVRAVQLRAVRKS